MKKSILACLVGFLSANSQASLMITGIFDGPLTGGVPKGVELYAYEDINDLSRFGIGSANNGGGSDGEEFSFPSVALSAGQYIYIASEQDGFNAFFGFNPDFISSALAINGDDAIELFEDGVIVDLFGDSNGDSSGQSWDYLDGWAYRTSDTLRSSVFKLGDWNFSGTNALDGATSNATATSPVPLASFTGGGDDGDDGGGDGGPDTITLISAIQGTPETQLENGFGETDVSPLIDQIVKVRAVVVGDFQDNDADLARNLSGFYLQEESSDEDGDTRSSEGIFVYDTGTSVDVALGDLVEVTATVDQYFGETQLSQVTKVDIIDSSRLADVTPGIVALSSNTTVTQAQGGSYQPDLEAYEGMLVSFSDALAISEQFQLDRFNEIRLYTGERPRQFTQDNAPDAVLLDQHLQQIGARTIVYDDGLSEQNGAVDWLDGFANYSEFSAKRMGDSVNSLSGILDYKWAGNSTSGATWRVRAIRDGDNLFTSSQAGNSPNPRPDVVPAVGGSVKVSSFNVLNFFSTIDVSGATTAAGHDPRGADSAEEFARQSEKLINALLELDADVYGLVELENEFDATNDGSTAIEILVNALNAVAGEGSYAYVYPGTQFVGSDAIAVGFIYKPSVVSLAEGSAPALLDDTVAAGLDVFSGRDFNADPIFNGNATNRVSLAVSFSHNDSGETFTVVANHFKSKGSSSLEDTASPNYDKGDGAGFWNRRRLDAATAVSEWLKIAPTGISEEDTILLGDFNAYAMEDPVQYLLGNGFVNVETPDAYSYVFDGQVGTLDYLLVSDALHNKIAGSAIWNINADEADAIDYNLDFGRSESYFNGFSPLRSSDHDPVIVGFNVDKELPDVSISEIIQAYNHALDDGSVKGVGFFRLWQLLNELSYYSVLYSAKWSDHAGNVTKTCHTLSQADLLSDEMKHPADIVKGEGLGDIRDLIDIKMESLSCK